MGIQDLLLNLRKRHPKVVQQDVYLEAFKGMRVGIDISIYAWKFMAVARKESLRYLDPLRQDPKHNVLRSFWLEKYFNFIMAFIEVGITPIATFDGEPFHLKRDTKDDRTEGYEKTRKDIEHLRDVLREGDNPKVMKSLVSKLANHVSFEDEDWEKLEEMLRAMGVPVFKADTEAEAACARLCHQGYTCATVSNDGDSLAHLSNIMIIDVKRSYRRGRPHHKCTCIVLEDVLKTLDMTCEQFTEFCMLCGTDYNRRIKGVGFVGAMKMIKKHGNLEAVIRVLRKTRNLENYRLGNDEVRQEIRDYFLGDIGVKLEEYPVLHYPGGLRASFEEIFVGFNRARMLQKADDAIEVLETFNQSFASLQIFLLVLNHHV